MSGPAYMSRSAELWITGASVRIILDRLAEEGFEVEESAFRRMCRENPEIFPVKSKAERSAAIRNAHIERRQIRGSRENRSRPHG